MAQEQAFEEVQMGENGPNSLEDYQTVLQRTGQLLHSYKDLSANLQEHSRKQEAEIARLTKLLVLHGINPSEDQAENWLTQFKRLMHFQTFI